MTTLLSKNAQPRARRDDRTSHTNGLGTRSISDAALFVLVHLALWGLMVASSGPTGVGGQQLLVLAWFAFIPGDLLRQACTVRVAAVADRFVLGVSGSIALAIIGLGVLEGLSRLVGAGLGPISSFEPLAAQTLLIASACVTAPLTLMAALRRRTPEPLISPQAALLTALVLVPPVLARLGAAEISMGSSPALTVFALAAAALMVLVAVIVPRMDPFQALALFGLVLTIAWSWSERTSDVFGYDVHQEFKVATRTVEELSWQLVPGDAYAAMLSITSLPVAVTQLTDLSLVTYFKTFAPVATACYILSVFVMARCWVSPRPALIAIVVTAIPAAIWQLPFITRQAYGLCLFAGICILLLPGPDTVEKRRERIVMALPMAVALPMTHYSTAYVTLAVLALGAASAFVLRMARRGAYPRATRVPLIVVLALASTIGFWNFGVTSSAAGLENIASEASDQPVKLRNEGSVIGTWLRGATTRQATPQEYFDVTRDRAAERPWLIEYSEYAQSAFVVEPVETLPHEGPAVLIGRPLDAFLLLLRQGANLLMIAGACLLIWRGVTRVTPRRQHTVGEDGPARDASATTLDFACLAAAALMVTAAMRVNASLSEAYNSERLLLQTSLLLVPGAALVLMKVEGRFPRGWSARGLLAATLVMIVLLLQLTGLRALLVGGDAGNVIADGEYSQRYTRTAADRAATDWLGSRYGPANLVFADFYAILGPMSDPRYRVGLFPELSPATVDQRAWALATTENIIGGRARLTADGIRTTFTFPKSFFELYKACVYSNGYAEVYR